MKRMIVAALVGGFVVKLFLVTGCGGVEKGAASPADVSAENGGGGGGACTKDTDCKGDRICVKSACVDPNAGK